MTRKPITLVFVTFLLALTLIVSGCKKTAAPALTDQALPDDSAAMIDEAVQNTEDMQTPAVEETAPPEEISEVDEPTATVSPEEPTSTPEPTEVPTEEATPEPTPVPELVEEPTPEPVAETVIIPGKHIVLGGENLFRIALRYGLTTEAVAQANNITNPALIYPGQELTIPSGSSSAGGSTGDAPVVGGDIVHTVLAGENLFRIALKYNYDQYYIARYNNISNLALVYPGQQVRIPSK